MRQISFVPNFAAWQRAAREALGEGIAPAEIVWEEMGDAQPGLGLFEEEVAPPGKSSRVRVPRAFVQMAERVACHREGRRWALLYRMLWRLTHGEPRLLEVAVDADVDELARLDKAVRREVHKMRAFVRFRAVEHAGATWYVAWFEPEHHVVKANAPFFRDRFAQMHWSILTPDRCAHWDGRRLSFTAGVPKSEAPGEDAVEALWVTYYGNIFNPARVKTDAMQAEMPKRYWKNLPEAAVIPSLLSNAPRRVETMLETSASHAMKQHEAHELAEPPPDTSMAVLKKAAAGCQACPLWRDATQTVFGEGPETARLVLVGEQPGDREDREGRAFIGPAGQMLDRALAEAGIDRGAAYVTNAVKHFKWEPRGKRRLHKAPSARDIASCRPWLEAELRAVRPEVLVCLGGSAVKSVVGAEARVLRDRGQVRVTEFCERTIITVHPSSLLRAPDEAAAAENYARFVADLRLAAALLPFD